MPLNTPNKAMQWLNDGMFSVSMRQHERPAWVYVDIGAIMGHRGALEEKNHKGNGFVRQSHVLLPEECRDDEDLAALGLSLHPSFPSRCVS